MNHAGARRLTVARRLVSPGPTVEPGARRVGDETDEGLAPLLQLVPHASFNPYQAASLSAAIAAHHRELNARLGRRVGLCVAALDYLVNVTRDLAAPTIVERDVLETLEHRSVTDPLTRLFNRFHFDVTLKREVARCLRYKARLSLLLLDVDRFKHVNDRWGHQAGDRMLHRVAEAIQVGVRTSDIACRYGGDEFAVILPDTDVRAGRLVAERIGAAVEELFGKRTTTDPAISVTLSGGLAALPAGGAAASEARLIAAADRALYRAKGSGGNCVVEERRTCPR